MNHAISGPDFDAAQLAKLERAAVYVGELMHTQNISPFVTGDGSIVDYG